MKLDCTYFGCPDCFGDIEGCNCPCHAEVKEDGLLDKKIQNDEQEAKAD